MLYDSASFLFDGGWRSDDRELLIAEYDLSLEEADEICSYLAEFERDRKEEIK